MLRFRGLLSALALAMSVAAAPALSSAAEKHTGPKPIEAEIPFARFGGVQDWHADGSRGIYIRGRGQDQWYYGTLMGPCSGLPFATTIGIEQDARDVIDRYSSIIVEGRRCALNSFVMSEPPPSQRKKEKARD
jgi:hypothetical protein